MEDVCVWQALLAATISKPRLGREFVFGVVFGRLTNARLET